MSSYIYSKTLEFPGTIQMNCKYWQYLLQLRRKQNDTSLVRSTFSFSDERCSTQLGIVIELGGISTRLGRPRRHDGKWRKASIWSDLQPVNKVRLSWESSDSQMILMDIPAQQSSRQVPVLPASVLAFRFFLSWWIFSIHSTHCLNSFFMH